MKSLPLLLLSVVVVLGCAKTNTLTNVTESGWSRATRYTLSKVMPGEMDPSKTFRLPSGPEWKVTTRESEQEMVITATRDFKLDETLVGDLSALSKDGKPLIENTVKITKHDDGRLEYVETIEWKGKPVKELDDDTKLVEFIRKSGLPDSVAKSPKLKDFSLAVARDLWKLLFGPVDPMLGQFLFHADAAEKRLKREIAKSMSTHLAKFFASELSESERGEFIRGVMKEFDADQLMDRSSEAEPSASQNNENGPVAMLIAVRLPGKIVHTNGEVDEYSGEVFWALYPEAAAIGKLELRATSKP